MIRATGAASLIVRLALGADRLQWHDRAGAHAAVRGDRQLDREPMASDRARRSGGQLDPSSSNICESGEPACMDAVVDEMSRRIAALGCSHLAPFATMYRQVSAEIRASVDARRYADPAYVAHLDSVFATFYFHALDSWRAGRRNQVPQAWRMAFSAADNGQVSTLGDMLLGMNAHISRDLPFALASVGLRYPDGRSATKRRDRGQPGHRARPAADAGPDPSPL